MEKHQAFMQMMARKKDLGKAGEGTSSPSKTTSHSEHSRNVNSTLKISDSQTPSTTVKPTALTLQKVK